MKIPPSEHFETIDMSSACNARRSELPDGFVSPHELSADVACPVFRGVPFLAPACDDSAGSDAIVVEEHGVTIELGGRHATYIVFLHQACTATTDMSGPFGSPGDGNRLGDHVADYVLDYADGESHAHPILRRFAVQQGSISWGASAFAAAPAVNDRVVRVTSETWELPDEHVMPFGRAETRHSSGRDQGTSLWMYALPNPNPDKPIDRIVLSPGSQAVAVFGVTTTTLQDHPLRWLERRKLLLSLPDGVSLNAIGELDDVAIDLGIVISARQQMVYDHARWRVDDPDLQPTASDKRVVVEYVAHPGAKIYVGQGDGADPVGYDLDALPALEAPSPVVEVPPAHRMVRIHVIDKRSRQPVGVRLHLHGEAGEYLPPRGFHRKVNGAWFEDNYAEFVNGLNQYAYVDGVCDVDLPLGKVYVEITRGYEIAPVREAVEITADTDELTFELERVLDWRSRGWVTADTHVHFLSPATARLEGSAEDVNVVNLLASQWGEMFSNVGDFDGRTTHGAVEGATGGDGENFLVRVGTENRMQVLGHISLLGYEGQMIHPLCTGGPSESALGDPQAVTMAEWAQRCRDQKGLVVMPHAPNPQCERVADVVLDLVDAIEMMTFNPHTAQINPVGLADWYRFLNAGYHLPLTGGSDKMAASSLLGGVRTYTQMGDRTFDYEQWMDATRGGNTFVTVGPLVELAVEGQSPGSKLDMQSPGTVSVTWKVESVRVPIEKIEVVMGGRVVHDVSVGGGLESSGVAEVKVDESTWIALLVRGSWQSRQGDIAAHSSAVVARVAGKEPWTPQAGHEMLKQIEGALAYVDTIATRPDAERYRKLRLTLETAWNRLHQRMHHHGVFHDHAPLHDHAEHHEH